MTKAAAAAVVNTEKKREKKKLNEKGVGKSNKGFGFVSFLSEHNTYFHLITLLLYTCSEFGPYGPHTHISELLYTRSDIDVGYIQLPRLVYAVHNIVGTLFIYFFLEPP